MKFCPCGKPAVKQAFGSMWSCQDCIDKDKLVYEMHDRQFEVQRKLLEDNDEEKKEAKREYYHRRKKAGLWIHWREYERRKLASTH